MMMRMNDDDALRYLGLSPWSLSLSAIRLINDEIIISSLIGTAVVTFICVALYGNLSVTAFNHVFYLL